MRRTRILCSMLSTLAIASSVSAVVNAEPADIAGTGSSGSSSGSGSGSASGSASGSGTGSSGAPTSVPAFGPDFLWGVAMAGFQSEGRAPDSNWSRYADSGKAPDRYGDSVDFYDRYAEDIDLAAGMGLKVFRLSIEWARVQPQPGVWDEAGFRFYDQVIQKIRAAGMRPMLTLDHWVIPGWEADRGGWKNQGMVSDWLTNMRRVVDRYAGVDPLWVTINEPMGYVAQSIQIGDIGVLDALPMFDRLVQAHGAIYDYIHQRQPGAKVTSNVAQYPVIQGLTDMLFVDRVHGKLDFIGADFYYGASLSNPPSPDLLGSELWKNAIEPEGIYYYLRAYAEKFPGLPICLVENGLPTDNAAPRADGYDRADHLRDTVYWLQRAKADGIDVMGYNYWSLTDNYEWGSYAPRFGLYTVDVKTDPTLTRRPTDAVAAFETITAQSGVPADYRPTRKPALCSIIVPLESCLRPVSVP
ncbi:family 1 glycosylhydrolase [Nocardia seriolae]|uniref:family 1 glycosylhydrolase n=1 Tax=Nocardia seriolae TaxID=37332 RepID=UPI00051A16FC|nr:family 1 glycosylhydrolase [Nocardia seriolae]MTJ64981.1 family 1 glycosylhydrolase [Nocardia seriolae]MTJ71835.1 family 1 glycosylhydrolase [Nocardia seriolae]MTJ89795.1 family 1 glycosylhydrolase [Nocardia seriolae]MTK33771.1 family 1 glycosylhydrolase [Nocardia seriolae]MTK42926.1 family 1 glycosylhydrolase [Nocardia seriolae]